MWITAILSALGVLQTLAPGIKAIFDDTIALLDTAFGGKQTAIEAGLEKARNLVVWADGNLPAVMAWAQNMGTDLGLVGTQLANLTKGSSSSPALSATGMAKLLYVAHNLAADLQLDIGTAIAMAQDAWKGIASAAKATAAPAAS